MSSETVVTTKANNIIIASVPCPSCIADAGQQCVETDGKDVGGHLDGIHGSRHNSYMMVFRASTINTPDEPYSEFDEVTRPKHYNSHPSGVECITIAQHHNYNIGAAIKYLWRQGLKDGAESITDLRKAIQYIEFEIRRLDGNVRERCECRGSYQCELHRGVRQTRTNVEDAVVNQVEDMRTTNARRTFPIPDGYRMLGVDEIINAGDEVWDGTKFVTLPHTNELVGKSTDGLPFPIIRSTGIHLKSFAVLEKENEH